MNARTSENYLAISRSSSTLKKNRPQYISAQKISTLFDVLDEREIAR
jgi:hypothetical protein